MASETTISAICFPSLTKFRSTPREGGEIDPAGGFSAWLIYRYLGLKFVSRTWFNLDAIWAVSLIFVGTLALAISLVSTSDR